MQTYAVLIRVRQLFTNAQLTKNKHGCFHRHNCQYVEASLFYIFRKIKISPLCLSKNSSLVMLATCMHSMHAPEQLLHCICFPLQTYVNSQAQIKTSRQVVVSNNTQAVQTHAASPH